MQDALYPPEAFYRCCAAAKAVVCSSPEVEGLRCRFDKICRFQTILLRLFEPPKPLVENAVRAFRGFNTLLDSIFYDVPTLTSELLERDKAVGANGEKPSRIIDFEALSDPEGSLLLIDAQTPPYVRKYKDVRLYLEVSRPRDA